MRLEKNSNRRAFRDQKARHPELEKRLCDYMNDKRQYGCAVSSEMCQLKALAITKEQCITGFKAILRLCQVAAGKWMLTWLVSGNGTAWQRPKRCTAPAHRAGFYLRKTHCSYNIRADRHVSSRKFLF